MKKVLYTVTRVGRENTKVSGVGGITDTDLVTAQISRNGKPYIRVYSDCLKYCHPVAGGDNEFKGAFWEIVEYEGREIELNYYIYYKIVD